MKNLRVEACETSCPVFAQIESLQLFLLRTFGLIQKYQKIKHGEKSRETFGVSLKRAPVAGLQANRPRFFTFDTARFFFCAFRSAIVQACGLRKEAESDVRIVLFAGLCILVFLAGRKPAYPRDVKMSEEEAAAHRAPGTIVR